MICLVPLRRRLGTVDTIDTADVAEEFEARGDCRHTRGDTPGSRDRRR